MLREAKEIKNWNPKATLTILLTVTLGTMLWGKLCQEWGAAEWADVRVSWCGGQWACVRQWAWNDKVRLAVCSQHRAKSEELKMDEWRTGQPPWGMVIFNLFVMFVVKFVVTVIFVRLAHIFTVLVLLCPDLGFLVTFVLNQLFHHLFNSWTWVLMC